MFEIQGQERETAERPMEAERADGVQNRLYFPGKALKKGGEAFVERRTEAAHNSTAP